MIKCISWPRLGHLAIVFWPGQACPLSLSVLPCFLRPHCSCVLPSSLQGSHPPSRFFSESLNPSPNVWRTRIAERQQMLSSWEWNSIIFHRSSFSFLAMLLCHLPVAFFLFVWPFSTPISCWVHSSLSLSHSLLCFIHASLLFFPPGSYYWKEGRDARSKPVCYWEKHALMQSFVSIMLPAIATHRSISCHAQCLPRKDGMTAHRRY